jgi:hypothetical protein
MIIKVTWGSSMNQKTGNHAEWTGTAGTLEDRKDTSMTWYAQPVASLSAGASRSLAATTDTWARPNPCVGMRQLEGNCVFSWPLPKSTTYADNNR